MHPSLADVRTSAVANALIPALHGVVAWRCSTHVRRLWRPSIGNHGDLGPQQQRKITVAPLRQEDIDPPGQTAAATEVAVAGQDRSVEGEGRRNRWQAAGRVALVGGRRPPCARRTCGNDVDHVVRHEVSDDSEQLLSLSAHQRALSHNDTDAVVERFSNSCCASPHCSSATASRQPQASPWTPVTGSDDQQPPTRHVTLVGAAPVSRRIAGPRGEGLTTLSARAWRSSNRDDLDEVLDTGKVARVAGVEPR